MNTNVKNFPKGLDEKDLLYLIWKALVENGSSSGGGSDSGSDSDSDSDSGDDTPSGGVQTLLVHGTVDDDNFTPDDGEPTFAEACEVIKSGGVVWLINPKSDDETIVYHHLAGFMEDYTTGVGTVIYGLTDGTPVEWYGPASDDSDTSDDSGEPSGPGPA